MNSTPEEVYEYLKSGKNGPQGTGNMFGIADSYSTKDSLKIMSVRYDVFMNRYSQTTPITVASNISDKSIAAISEHQEEYPGVAIKADSLRKYNDAKYFSAIMGYTGVIICEPIVWFIMVIPLLIQIFRMPVLRTAKKA